MAPIAIDDRQSSSLRAITFRLTSTPLQHLPKISAPVAAQLISCKQILSTSQDAVSRENAALLHSFKTRLSSLLQDRTVEGRWTAVVLVKATIELGGSEFLLADKERCAGWIRGLTGILHKPDPLSTKQMAIITLTRIFMLTRDHQTLLRELTTPSLTPYITACLNHFQNEGLLERQSQRSLLLPVLESFSLLVPRHPTVFRSFSSKVRGIALQILSQAPFELQNTNTYCPPRHLASVAQKILVQLHQCAQKNGSAEECNVAVRAVVASAHVTADQIFRAISEDWESVAGVRSTLDLAQPFPDQPELDKSDQVGLTAWTGLRSGSERILTLLGLLTQYISTPGTSAFPLQTGVIVDLLNRLVSLRVPKDRNGASNRYNNQVSRTERDDLWSVLPSIHVAAIEVFLALSGRVDATSNPCSAQLLDSLPWLFESESTDVFLRTATYKAVRTVLTSTGPSLPKSSVATLEKIMQLCCRDLMPAIRATEISASNGQLQNGSKSGQQNINGNQSSTTTTTATSTPTEFPGLHNAAYNLLPILLGKLPAQHIPVPARTELDRVAVLIKHQDALTASVLNPSPYKPSVLPLMAILCPTNLATESLLRPRMPVIRTSIRKEDDESEEVDEGYDPTIGSRSLHGVFETRIESEDTYEDQLQNTIASSVDQGGPTHVESGSVWESSATTPFASALAEINSNKRLQEQEDPPQSQPKRLRREVEQLQLPVPAHTVQVVERVVETETTTYTNAEIKPLERDVNMAGTGANEEDNDSDDGSDFEIPKLYVGGDSDDDDEEEENGD